MKNVTKSLSFLAILGSLFFITSCGDDDGTGGGGNIDETVPSITVNAPQAGDLVAAGSQVATSISISDDIEISSVSITVGNGTVTVFEFDETEIGDASYTFNQNISIPANVVLGQHSVDITVEDASGNVTTAGLNIEALPAFADGQTTVMVAEVTDQVADYTGDNQIYMVGAHQGDADGAGAWDPTSGTHPLSIHEDSEGTATFFVQVPNTGVSGFKFVRTTGGWDFGEKGAVGEEIDNRVIEAGSNYVTADPIASWKDYNPDVQDNSSATVIEGTGTTSITIQGNVVLALTTQAAVSSATYTVLDDAEMEVATGSVDVDANGGYSETLSIEGFELGAYSIQVLVVDASNNSGRGDASLNIVEFPCDDSGEEAVAATMTRLIINVPATDDDIYATGNFDGDIWGTVADTYKLTKLSDGCYYIDLALTSGQIVQFFRSNPGYADWWRGQATNTQGSDATANFNVDADSDGGTVKLFYAFWREEPSSGN